MKAIGFVNDIKRENSKQIVTVVLNFVRELQSDKLILGEFVIREIRRGTKVPFARGKLLLRACCPEQS